MAVCFVARFDPEMASLPVVCQEARAIGFVVRGFLGHSEPPGAAQRMGYIATWVIKRDNLKMSLQALKSKAILRLL